jgi:hypothetical protein
MAGTALSLLVAAELARQALGPDALLLIDNVIRHEGPPPRAAPALVRGLLASPLDAADAAALFRRSVPLPLQEPARVAPAAGFERLLERYVAELALARESLPPVAWAPRGFPSAERLLSIGGPYDGTRFFEATLQFAAGLRNVPLGSARRIETGIGTVIVGGTGDDAYGPGAAIIIDPGGNDTYERAPAADGAVSVVVDLAGDDRYAGSDIAAGGLSALVDLPTDSRV